MGDTYDSKIGWDEFVLGIQLLRWSLITQATGRVRSESALDSQRGACSMRNERIPDRGVRKLVPYELQSLQCSQSCTSTRACVDVQL
jgi:hypothetical protein